MFFDKLKTALPKLKNLATKGHYEHRTEHSLGDTKIFIIGYNKTGTTSIKKLFRRWGFNVGSEVIGHLLTEDWLSRGETDRIFRFCEMAQVFQDKPFSTDGMYAPLAERFPDAKFILTVRDHADQWYESWIRYLASKVSKDGQSPPTLDELKQSKNFIYRGYLHDSDVLQWGEENLYKPEVFKIRYNAHIAAVRDYFKDRPDRFIEINVSQQQDYQRLVDFLGIKTTIRQFPHENKSV